MQNTLTDKIYGNKKFSNAKRRKTCSERTERNKYACEKEIAGNTGKRFSIGHKSNQFTGRRFRNERRYFGRKRRHFRNQ
ncbi:MAG: hypothetical protein LBN23_06190 [Paludibacter sp.]|nr:hypothetical protein [Paludibacter sp.]